MLKGPFGIYTWDKNEEKGRFKIKVFFGKE
jgi:hypothetical protein